MIKTVQGQKKHIHERSMPVRRERRTLSEKVKLVSSGLFLKSPESFRAYFGCHDSLYIFATPRLQANKLRNPISFYYIKNVLKDQLFKISRLQFDDWLFGPEKFSGLSRNRPQVRKFYELPTFCKVTDYPRT